MQDEHNGGGQQPDAWAAWTAQSGRSGEPASDRPDPDASQAAGPGEAQPGAAAPGLPGSFAQPGAYAQPGDLGGGQLPPPPPPAFGQQAGYTQPIGYGPQGDYGQPGGYSQASGYGQPGGYSQASGYGQPGGYGPPGPYGYGPQGGYGQPGPYGYGQPPRRRRRRLTNAIVYLAVALVAATAGGVFVELSGNQSQPSANSGANNGSGSNPFGNGFPFGNPSSGSGSSGSGNPRAGANVSNSAEHKVQSAVLPGLVVISSNLQYQGDAAEATGMVVTSSGYVLTNNHVIAGTTALTATVVATGQRFKAHWIGYDKSDDVAVIKLEGASNLRTVPIGDSNAVKVGDGVVALGNAGGSGGITTVKGDITGLNQSITASDDGSGNSEHLTNMLETNAYIIPGDSGGPLASTGGKVIGMDTAASTDTIGSGQQNVGFAIPINRAMDIAHQIIGGQPSTTIKIGSVGFLGVLVTSGHNGQQSTESSPQQQLQQQEQNNSQNFGGTQFPPGGSGCLSSSANAGVPSKIAPVSSGTLVIGSLCGTPASAAGIHPGDVITALNGHAISSPSSLVGVLSALRSGQTVKVSWVTSTDHSESQRMILAAAPPQ